MLGSCLTSDRISSYCLIIDFTELHILQIQMAAVDIGSQLALDGLGLYAIKSAS